MTKAALGQEELRLPEYTVVRTVDTPTIEVEVSVATSAPPEWATNIMKLLQNVKVSGDPEEAQKFRNRAAQFTLMGGVLYKMGFSKPLLKCISLNNMCWSRYTKASTGTT